MRRGGISPVKKSGALAGRLGVRPGTENIGPKIRGSNMEYVCLQAQQGL